MVVGADTVAPESFQYCSMVRGIQVLDLLSLPHECFNQSVAALCIIAIAFRAAAFVVLEMLVRERKMQIKRAKARLVKTIRAAARGCIRRVRECTARALRKKRHPRSATTVTVFVR